MISETARLETQVGGRQWTWAQGTARLAGALVLLGVGALLCVLLVTAAAKPWGYQTYVIYGSSMEPAIEVGSLVVAKPAKVDGLQVGDIIVFPSPSSETTVTHRIVGISEEHGERYFATKGDASSGADPLEVSLENGAQQVVYHAPYLGYFVHFARSTLGILLLLVLPALGLLALYLTKGGEAAAKDRQAAEEA